MWCTRQRARWRKWLVVLCGGWGWQAWAAPLVLATSAAAPYTTERQDGFLDRLVATVFAQAGLEAQVSVYADAAERSLSQANTGQIDGQLLLVSGAEKWYPNLVRVPEPVLTGDFVALVQRKPLYLRGWDDLKPYHVSYLIGWKLFDIHLPPSVERTQVRQPEQMFALLERKRTDVVLYERWQARALMQARGFDVHMMEPPLLSVPMYIYLHKKHERLVPRVAQALADYKRTAAWEQLRQDTLEQGH